jgi:5-(carboxyamino)imidazole ribonucleotide synthase
MNAPTIGIIGAGQLGRMMALAAYPLGVNCVFLDSSRTSPGGQVGSIVTAELDDTAALIRLADSTDVVTVDIENVPVAGLEAVARRVALYPPPAAIAAAQDRLEEKELFASLGIPTVPFVPVSDRNDLEQAAALGWPLVLKTRRLGYDGRGQWLVHDSDELAQAWEALGQVPAIAEAWIQFEREVSLIGVFGADGACGFYPLTENVHRQGQLFSSVAPFQDAHLQARAEQCLQAVAERFGYRGVLTVEFFHTSDGLLVNEMAPRVHNSGHWTIEGAQTSQFENHMRAVLGWPLGSTAARGHAAMLNLLGRMPPTRQLLAVPGLHLHDYGKSPRPARKLGHCTLVDDDRHRLLERLTQLQEIIDSQQT